MSGNQKFSGWRRDHQSRGLRAALPATRGTDGPASSDGLRLRPAGGLVAPKFRRRRNEGGFTLVEVLLALALLAALLAALNQFVFAITEAWTKNQDHFTFTQHTRAVARHVDGLLQASLGSVRASNATAGGPAIEEIRLPGGGSAELLVFDLPAGDRLFLWPDRPLPEVRCALAWRRDEGLVLYWNSRLEEDFATAEPRMAVVSPFVTALAYDYYDATAQRWSTETELQKDTTGAYQTPRRLRLRFVRHGQEAEELIPLTALGEGLPAY